MNHATLLRRIENAFSFLQYLAIVQKSSFILGSNDGFFNFYLNFCIVSASFTIALINNVSPGKFGNNYYMCTGQDPAKFDYLGKKVYMIKASNADTVMSLQLY